MSDVDRHKSLIEMLHGQGVKRARFDKGELVEVEFFGAEPPPSEPGSTLPADETTTGVEDYEQALSQIRSRRFPKKDAVA